MLNKAHDAATNKGTAITIKRVSISDNPFKIFKLNTLYIIYYNQKISTFQVRIESQKLTLLRLKFSGLILCTFFLYKQN
jgi:hypothetical protein